jgi:hypothetical protein
MKHILLYTLLALVTALPLAGRAASYDILVGEAGRQLSAGFFVHGSLPPSTGFATDRLTGQPLFPANFGDFAGGPQATNDPGFQSFAGTLAPGTIVSVQGIGTLEYWNPSSLSWTAPPGGEEVRLHGAVPTDIAVAYTFCQSGGPLCDAGLAAQYPFYAQGTAFSASGVSGPNPAIVDDADANGAFHAHLDWFIERPDSMAPAAGAYLVTFALVADGYQASHPVKAIFNHGLSDTQYQLAFASRIQPVPEPSGMLLMLAGLAFLAAWFRHTQTDRIKVACG